MEKHFLASANTSIGFINKFNFINPNENSFTFILKGGPGTGKSTIMKQLSKKYLNKSDIEYFYCSSDPESLDGVRILSKNISVVDGTAPHITEATIPGVKEKIVNVGEFIKEEIKKDKKQIEKYLNKKTLCFKKAYKYLNAIKPIIDIEILQTKIKDENFDFLNLTKQKNKFEERVLFFSFINSNGLNYIYKKNKYKKVFYLKNDYINNCKNLLKLSNILKENNYKFISFLSVLNPELIEGIFIEKLNILVLAFKLSSIQTLKNKNIINVLIKKAGKQIEMAKKYHKIVESFYIKNMNFDKLNNYLSTVF